MAVKKNARVPRKRVHSRPIEKLAKSEAPVEKGKKRKALVIAQEIKFARLLANNDKKVRDKMVKNLKKWLTVRSDSSFAFTESDFLRLWKGLFYCMWMSDKPLIQEELAETLSNIVHCFESLETALLYTKCTLKTLAIEWFGIDRYRLDKFQMLTRRIIRQTFEMCRRRSWAEEWVKGVASVIENLLTDEKRALGFNMHITEVYMEELAKIGGGTILPDQVKELVRPFAVYLASLVDEQEMKHVMKHVFRYLIFQSDVGMDYMEKFEAWRQAGFPCKSIDELEKVEVSDEEPMEEDEDVDENVHTSLETKVFDPRAGRVDVELPQLPFDPSAIAALIKEYKFHPKSTSKTRRQILHLIREFTELAHGNMPLGMKEVVLPQRKHPDTNPKKAAVRLLEFEKELYSDTIRRKRKRKQILPIDDVSEDFESVFTPLNEDEIEQDRFHEEEEHEELENGVEENEDTFDMSHIDDMDEIDDIAEKFHNREKKSKKKMKKKISDDGVASSKNVALKKSLKKKMKKEKNAMKVEKVDQEVEKKESTPEKIIKVKSKKTKTKKLQSAISYLNKKFLNRSPGDSGIPKAKKSRQSIDGAWDISDNDDSMTTPASPSIQTSPKSEVPKKAGETPEGSVPTSPSTLPKEQLNKIPWLVPVLTKLEDEKTKQQTPIKTQAAAPNRDSSGKKRVKIVLRNNTAQNTSEYMKQLQQSPAIPYDSNRKPLAGVLKPSPLSSPVNPFYKRA